MQSKGPFNSPGFGPVPPVTKNLLLITILVFISTILLKNSIGLDLNRYLALHHHKAAHFMPHQFVTYIFMHNTVNEYGQIDLMHIVFNMLGLFFFGPMLEYEFGPKRFLIFYLLTGIGSTAIHYILVNNEVSHALEHYDRLFYYGNNANEKLAYLNEREHLLQYLNQIQIVGASGSLYGLLGAFGYLYPNAELRLFFLIPIKAAWAVILFGLLEFYSNASGNRDGVAHLVHLGALPVAFGLIYYWRKRG